MRNTETQLPYSDFSIHVLYESQLTDMPPIVDRYSTDSRAIFHRHLALPALAECRPVYWLTYRLADTQSSVSRHIDQHVNQYSNRDQHIGQYCRPILN